MTWKHRLSDVDPQEKTATCSACGFVRVTNKGRKSDGSIKYGCSVAKSEIKVGRHGLSHAEARRMRSGARCEICASTENLKVDHDHATMEIRGILCNSCNVAIGHMRDSPERLRRAADYLEK